MIEKQTLSFYVCKLFLSEILRESIRIMNLETKRQKSAADRLHWSFSDGPNLTKVVFPEGFSSEESTLPTGKFDPLTDWEQSYDVVFPK